MSEDRVKEERGRSVVKSYKFERDEVERGKKRSAKTRELSGGGVTEKKLRRW